MIVYILSCILWKNIGMCDVSGLTEMTDTVLTDSDAQRILVGPLIQITERVKILTLVISISVTLVSAFSIFR